MTVPEDAWVFDTGPLRHFAIQGWLGVLRFLADGHPVYIPDSVARELDEAADHAAAARAVLEANWINVYQSTDLGFGRAFSRYADRLVANRKNLGECGVLAMGELFGCKVVIDDATPYRIAEEMNIDVTATVPLLCQAVSAKRLTLTMVEELADNLLEGDYYLPFSRGGFRQHVIENGLLDYEEAD
ncbi:nucleotide-binding protein [Mycolicibacterium sp. CBMA 226]|uniref:nucleotide-binding protein n=1 Tax=Mycolicibacterium sp. CBMA 226 TaxID=2606611 RepID=UPI0012DC95C0|nr:nucleotide-binding protein [Mycolicibacterium sp. CBMA 226]MUL76449.1 nucleotide-binding protein [Mycolicibacterium sp. CBMA 226]